tara:strand:- start:285 stop:443 length:159 start_codon:yes stop_codon:yes gene_type:complete
VIPKGACLDDLDEFKLNKKQNIDEQERYTYVKDPPSHDSLRDFNAILGRIAV